MRVPAPPIGRRSTVLAGTVAAVALLMLFAARGARAAELVYWENPLESQIGVVNVDGTGASLLNTTGAGIDAPEGLSYDPVTNRLYVAVHGVEADGHIAFVNLDGSGGGSSPLPPGTPAIKDPRGVVVDPVGRIAYWLNNTDSTPETISWARLDGSEGGELPLGGQPLSAGTERLALDPAGGRLFWGNTDGSIHYAPLVGGGGTAGELEAKSNGGGANFLGINFDAASGRLFWVEFGINAVWTAGLSGTTKNEVVSGVSAAINQPAGLAFDPGLNRLYWANSGVENSAKGALGFAAPGGAASEITPSGVPVNHPQDPLVIKSPTGAAAPQVTLANGRLQCSQGAWGRDYVSSFVYQSPRSFSYRWTLGGSAIAGATEASYAPPTSGSYACVVTATNQAGSSSQTSAAMKVTVTTRPGKTNVRPTQQNKPANLQILGKARHLKARPGKLLTLKVRTTNQGDATSNPAKLCLKLTKGAKRAMFAGKCQRLGALRGDATDTAKLRLRVKGSAQPGLYKLRISLPGDRVKVTVRVLG